ncbi:MAG: hypothetical protein NC394_09675 [Bacteroides sp.]|nr:hypothetical protein [Bacteroides sp.]
MLTEDVQGLLGGDRLKYLETVGANDTYWMLQDNRIQDRWMPADIPPLVQMKDWAQPYTVYTGQYDVSFSPETDVYSAYQRIEALRGKMLPKLLLASSEEEFEELWSGYVREREEKGLKSVLEESTAQMNTLKSRLGIS